MPKKHGLDWQDPAAGRTAEMVFAVKGFAWHRRHGLGVQHGARVAANIDGLTILGEDALLTFLEEKTPTPTLFPNGNRGMPMALTAWRDRMTERPADTPEGIMRAHGGLVARQMRDGRAFLQGDELGLADIVSFSWMDQPAWRTLWLQEPVLGPWSARMREATESLRRSLAPPLSWSRPVTDEDPAPVRLTALNGATVDGRLIKTDDAFFWVETDAYGMLIASPLTHYITPLEDGA
ncbi:hypothetical protein [Eilatimonas milleporae]|uniref:Glutathione S-transferase n=1 Tax=Eilatimonas milleporae TaxID=911205 RepID=A0A3M0CDS1_9PROT|nr:hypothetical protein [Eilatimonas milleporae]RMB07974.1 hypothetical protein BXY39_2068 [Eilatimonas milleporae]